MKIHRLWTVCVLTRLILVLSVVYFGKKNDNIRYLLASLLLGIGLGFIYKGFTGSNDEVQIAKVFWHETRYIHGMLYLLASILLFSNKVNIAAMVVLADLLFSFSYRLISNN